MIVLKSRRELKLMREAGQLVAEAHRRMEEMIAPGVTTAELDAVVERLFAEHDATPLFKGYPGEVPFPAVTCISLNEEVVHGIPGPRALREGDIVSIDTGCKLNGWCGDSAWTYPVGEVSPLKARLLEVGQRVLETAIEEMGRQKWWSEVAARMVEETEKAGFSVVENFVGHGIGSEMHEDPQVPNYLSEELKKHDFRLEPGIVLAIEPMIAAGSKEVALLDDQWTAVTVDGRPSVHFEHTVALTAAGPQILTERSRRLVAS